MPALELLVPVLELLVTAFELKLPDLEPPDLELPALASNALADFDPGRWWFLSDFALESNWTPACFAPLTDLGNRAWSLADLDVLELLDDLPSDFVRAGQNSFAAGVISS